MYTLTKFLLYFSLMLPSFCDQVKKPIEEITMEKKKTRSNWKSRQKSNAFVKMEGAKKCKMQDPIFLDRTERN